MNSTVVLYADKRTDSIIRALAETKRRRLLQLAFNKKHSITPLTIIKPIKEKEVDIKDTKHIPKKEIPNLMIQVESGMRAAADRLDFEEAIRLREKLRTLEKRLEKPKD